DLFLREVQRLAQEMVGIPGVTRIASEDQIKHFVKIDFLHIKVWPSESLLWPDARCGMPSPPSRSPINLKRYRARVVPVSSGNSHAQCNGTALFRQAVRRL